MNETKTTFTPGPWGFCFQSVDPEWAIVSTAGGSVIANVNADCRQNANARLIAAAPDMYAAASEIIRLHDTYTGEPRDDDAISLAMADLRAALARANGEG